MSKTQRKSRKHKKKGSGFFGPDRSSFPKSQKTFVSSSPDPDVEARIAAQKAAAEAIAKKALADQAARKATKSKSDSESEEEGPQRRGSESSVASGVSEPKLNVNPLWLPKQPGSSTQKNRIRHFGVQRVVDGGRGRKRKTRRRKTKHRK